MKRLTIADNINGCLSFDLRDILVEIQKGSELTWTLSDMSISFIINDGSFIQATDHDYDFIQAIIDSKKPYNIDWQELNRLAALNIQTIDGSLIAKNNQEKIEIKVFGSSYWRITTSNDNLISRLLKRFSSVTIEETNNYI